MAKAHDDSVRSEGWTEGFRDRGPGRWQPPIGRPGMPTFETEVDATKEDTFRVESLNRVLPIVGPVSWLNVGHAIWAAQWPPTQQTMPPLDGIKGRELVGALQTGTRDGLPPRTLASSLGMRAIRQSVVDAMLHAFTTYSNEDLRTFTILNEQWVFTPAQLDCVEAAKLTKQLRTHLERAGVLTLAGPFICFLHGEFEPVRCVYVLHFHGVTTAGKARALDRLKNRWGYAKSQTRAAPIRREQVRDRGSQFSYLLKSYWPSKGVRNVGGVSKRDRRHHRIPEPYHAQVLIWLHSQSLTNITLMNDCWSPRKGGCEAMRGLYLSVHQW